MKKTVFVVLVSSFLISTSAFAQAKDVSATVKEKMQLLSWIQGTWTGQMDTGRGGKQQAEPIQMTVTANFLLDGMILTIDGVGKQGGATTKHYYATVTYDVPKDKYVMLAMTEDGHMGEPTFKASDQGFVWGMKVGRNHVKYTIENQGGKWHEVGSTSKDGETWTQNFEMTLTK